MHIEAILRNSLIYWVRQGARNSNGTVLGRDKILPRQFSRTCEKLFGRPAVINVML